MTSYQLLNSVALWLGNAGLINGMDIKYYRWIDTGPKGSVDFICLRMAGPSGPRSSKVQQPDIKLLVVGREAEIEINNDKADAIFQFMGGTEAPIGMIKIEPQASVMGPFFLDNGRCVFEINARCFVEDM